MPIAIEATVAVRALKDSPIARIVPSTITSAAPAGATPIRPRATLRSLATLAATRRTAAMATLMTIASSCAADNESMISSLTRSLLTTVAAPSGTRSSAMATISTGQRGRARLPCGGGRHQEHPVLVQRRPQLVRDLVVGDRDLRGDVLGCPRRMDDIPPGGLEPFEPLERHPVGVGDGVQRVAGGGEGREGEFVGRQCGQRDHGRVAQSARALRQDVLTEPVPDRRTYAGWVGRGGECHGGLAPVGEPAGDRLEHLVGDGEVHRARFFLDRLGGDPLRHRQLVSGSDRGPPSWRGRRRGIRGPAGHGPRAGRAARTAR